MRHRKRTMWSSRRIPRSFLAFFIVAVFSLSIPLAQAAEPQLHATSDGTTVAITGTSWAPSTPIVLSGTFGTTTVPGQATTDATGAFRTSLNVPSGFVGKATIEARGKRLKGVLGTGGGNGTANSTITPSQPTPTPETTPGSQPSAQAAPNVTAGTWLSGVSKDGPSATEFGAWRGEPVTIMGGWADVGLDIFIGGYVLEAIPSDLAFDYATGAWGRDGSSGSLAQAAAGAYDAQWTEGVKKTASLRPNATTYYRPFHEMNGDWYPWRVTAGQEENFKQAWIRYTNIVRANDPNGKMTIGYNANTAPGNATAEQMWPGDEYVDVIGVDFYDQWPTFSSQSVWDQNLNEEQNSSPRGLATWQAFAVRHGKPLAFPEWGLHRGDKNGASTDNPLYIELMHNFFRTNAGSGPGQVLYDIYFNIDSDAGAVILPNAPNPNAASKYTALSWGV